MRTRTAGGEAPGDGRGGSEAITRDGDAEGVARAEENRDGAAAKDTRAADRARETGVADKPAATDLSPGACVTNADCPAKQYCNYFPNYHCPPTSVACAPGAALDIYCDAYEGHCVAKAENCSAVIRQACGCDAKTYDNACVMSAAGVSAADYGQSCAAITKK